MLDEFLTHFSGYGSEMRSRVALTARQLLRHPSVVVIPQSRDSFLAGLSLFESRLDKGYRLTDCISMDAMRRESISEVLTRDSHFAQEGFVLIL